MAPDDYELDVLYRLQERYRQRVGEGDPGALTILTANKQLIQEHKGRAAEAAKQLGKNRGR
jgi:hypothetical protein